MFNNNGKKTVNNNLEIQIVNKKSMIKDFILLPWTTGIYNNDSAWVPPIIKDQEKMLNQKKGYFFEHGEAAYFLAYKDGKLSGRISAHINRQYENYYDRDTGFFGFFESINDTKVSQLLFSKAESWLKERGKTIINGPQSFSIYDSVGFDTFGQDILPVTGLYHFAPYYKELALDYGFAKCKDWHCVIVKEIADYKPFLEHIKKNILGKIDIKFSTLNMKELKTRSSQIKRIFNKAWEGNWGHLPITDRQFEEFFKEISRIVIPQLAIFAEKEGETVGFILTIPDVNMAMRYLNGKLYPWQLPNIFKIIKKTERLRTIIMGILPEYRRKMIDTVLYLKTIETAIDMGYKSSDCSLIVETNKKLLNTLKRLKGQIYKTYRIYEKKIL